MFLCTTYLNIDKKRLSLYANISVHELYKREYPCVQMFVYANVSVRECIYALISMGTCVRLCECQCVQISVSTIVHKKGNIIRLKRSIPFVYVFDMRLMSGLINCVK